MLPYLFLYRCPVPHASCASVRGLQGADLHTRMPVFLEEGCLQLQTATCRAEWALQCPCHIVGKDALCLALASPSDFALQKEAL